MATYTTLTSLFTAIADAIRTKDGTTGSIVADTFPQRILGITSGGGGISKSELIEALQYSGLGLTESSTDAEIIAALEYAFPPYEYLFRANRENLLTGGWNLTYQGDQISEPAVDSSGFLSTTCAGNYPYATRISKVGFDLTNYTKCYFAVEAITESNGNANTLMAVGFHNAATASSGGVLPAKYCKFSDVGLYEFDIEDLEGVYYPTISIRYRQKGEIKFSAIYLQ